MPSTSLAGKVAIVTGAGRGLGRAHALALAAEGATVVVNDLPESEGGESASTVAESTAREIIERGGNASVSHQDITGPGAGEKLVDECLASHGQLDVLVNNAGMYRDSAFLDASIEDWDVLMQVHGRATLVLTQAAASHWRALHSTGVTVRASVINTTSTAGLKPNPGHALYGAAKGAVNQLTTVAAAELAPYGIRVNAIAPAAHTRMVDAMSPLAFSPQARVTMTATDRSGQSLYHPALVSRIVTYLASDASTETGRIFLAFGNRVGVFQPWHLAAEIELEDDDDATDVVERMASLDVELLAPY